MWGKRSFEFAAYTLLPLVAFVAWVHPAVLDPTRTGWILDGRDWGATALGLASYLRAGDWPGSWTPLLMAPEGVHLLVTDGNPLLGLLLKPFAPILPHGVQFVGWWLLACLVLHVVFARLLVRHFVADPLRLWLGTALLTALPTLYARLMQVNLCAHWLLLWALWLFVDRSRSARPIWWLAVIGLAGLIHSYLLLMVGAIWASAMLRAVWTGDTRERWRTAIIVGAVAIELSLILVFHGIGEPWVSTHSYGAYPMQLDSLVNPDIPRFTALMPSSGPPDAAQWGNRTEGFQYLGAGVLALMVVMAVDQWRRRRESSDAHRDLRTLAWFIPAGIVLTLLAVGNLPLVGGKRYLLFNLPYALVDMLDMVRASGRLFWPVSYMLVLVTIVLVARLRHGRALLAAALVLQLIDIAPMFAALRPETARADDPAQFRRLVDPRWSGLVAGARDIAFLPADDSADRLVLEELGWHAMLAGRPIRFAYVARHSRSTEARLARDEAAFASARLDPRRLYVLLPGESVPVAVRSRTLSIDGLTVVPPTQIAR